MQILVEMDCILFSLLILKGLSDSKGHVWRCHPSHLYLVEVTVPENVVCELKYVVKLSAIIFTMLGTD